MNDKEFYFIFAFIIIVFEVITTTIITSKCYTSLESGMKALVLILIFFVLSMSVMVTKLYITDDIYCQRLYVMWGFYLVLFTMHIITSSDIKPTMLSNFLVL